MPLPKEYEWLRRLMLPQAVAIGLSLYGTLETPGKSGNPTIIAMADAIAERFPSAYNRWAATFYDDDGIAWCGLFTAYCEALAGRAPVDKYLSALAWRNYGKFVTRPMLGDLCIKTRSGGGHVTRYIAEDETHFHCLGANQKDAVNILRYPKTQFQWFRRPAYRLQPPAVRIYKVAPVGALAGSEA